MITSVSRSLLEQKGKSSPTHYEEIQGIHQLCSAGNRVSFIHKYVWMCMNYQRYHGFSSWLMTTNTASRSWKKHLARVGQHKLLKRSNELCLWVVVHTCDILNWTIAYSEKYILTGVKWSDCTVISHRYVKTISLSQLWKSILYWLRNFLCERDLLNNIRKAK